MIFLLIKYILLIKHLLKYGATGHLPVIQIICIVTTTADGDTPKSLIRCLNTPVGHLINVGIGNKEKKKENAFSRPYMILLSNSLILMMQFQEFKAFAELRKRLQPLALAIFSYGKVNGLLTKKDFQHAATHVLLQHSYCWVSTFSHVYKEIFILITMVFGGRCVVSPSQITLSTSYFMFLTQTLMGI